MKHTTTKAKVKEVTLTLEVSLLPSAGRGFINKQRRKSFPIARSYLKCYHTATDKPAYVWRNSKGNRTYTQTLAEIWLTKHSPFIQWIHKEIYSDRAILGIQRELLHAQGYIVNVK